MKKSKAKTKRYSKPNFIAIGVIVTAILIGILYLGPDTIDQVLRSHLLQANNSAGWFSMEIVAKGLTLPVDVADLSDGRLLIVEKAGKIRIVENGVLVEEPLIDISDHVNTYWDRGLLSLALDPDFKENGHLYVFYSYEPNKNSSKSSLEYKGPKTGRLTQIKVDPVELKPLVNPPERVILGSISEPYSDVINTSCQAGSDCIPTDGGAHGSGSILFAEDKTMFISFGDGTDPKVLNDLRSFRSQDIDWLSGKIIHIDRNGKGLATNPFYNGNPDAPRSKVYQYGMRYPFRITFDSKNDIYIADVGEEAWEEIDNGPPGANFGWPCYEGNYSNEPYLSKLEICKGLKIQNITLPIYSYNRIKGQSAAIIGGTFYTGKSYPKEYMNNYFWADFAVNQGNGFIKRMVINESGEVSIMDFYDTVITPVKVFSFNDRNIGWISLKTGEVYKFKFSYDNRPPVILASADKSYGPEPLTVKFSGKESFDPDGGNISYQWSFGDGKFSSEVNPEHTFKDNVTRTTTLTVTDGASVSTTQLIIHVGNTPPEITITNPVNDSISGQVINYSATIIDPEDGPLKDDKVTWRLIAQHIDHEHIVIDDIRGTSGTLPADYPGEHSSYKLEVTASDSRNLKTVKSIYFNVTWNKDS